MGTRIPLVRAVTVQLAARFLGGIGVPVERHLTAAKLSPRVLQDPESLVPFAAAARFVEEAARAEGIEDLGLRIGQQSSVQQLGTFGRLIAQSATLYEGLQTAYRICSNHNSSARTWLTRNHDEVRAHHRFVDGTEDNWRHLAAVALMHQVNLVASVAGPDWRPTEVQVPMRSLPGCRAIGLLSDARIEFGRPATTVTFAASLLHRALPRARAVAAVPGDADWERSRPADDVGGAVQQIVTTMLRDGYPDVHLVAEAVRMSARTLQRRLHDERLTFARIVDRARLDVARRMLDDPDRKVIDVALDLGYSDPAHFTRAFERWTGLAPREFRRTRAANRSQLPAA